MTPARAFAEAYARATRTAGARTTVKLDDPLFGRLAERGLQIAREHWSREKAGERLEPVAAWTARYLAPWAYDNEPEFTAVVNHTWTAEDRESVWKAVWTPACTALIDAARAERAAREQGRAVAA